ncbi:hypothetical protein [Mesorhizobium sp. ES1-6]|uniref:hypothetical protein n=1 Tax=Mesorhizobium sp. ES1-6 TaxID=2876626 RepID=UPI001CCC3743|nr:hypothetical protein [Mesorhizobium sp. ES1-6]MBZ9801148.1 hypothetical protein [Mesorhizobium sp. ES1-6]
MDPPFENLFPFRLTAITGGSLFLISRLLAGVLSAAIQVLIEPEWNDQSARLEPDHFNQGE